MLECGARGTGVSPAVTPGLAALPASTLAHGDERKLEVARALAIEPRFILMDEPAAGLPEGELPGFAEVPTVGPERLRASGRLDR